MHTHLYTSAHVHFTFQSRAGTTTFWVVLQLLSLWQLSNPDSCHDCLVLAVLWSQFCHVTPQFSQPDWKKLFCHGSLVRVFLLLPSWRDFTCFPISADLSLMCWVPCFDCASITVLSLLCCGALFWLFVPHCPVWGTFVTRFKRFWNSVSMDKNVQIEMSLGQKAKGSKHQGTINLSLSNSVFLPWYFNEYPLWFPEIHNFVCVG